MQIQRKMTDLLEGLDYTTAKGDDATITGLAFHSDKVTHGDLFFCIPGFKSDGHAYAPDAVSRGCAALVVKRKLDLEVPQFIVEDPRKYMGIISSRFYGDPSEQMDVVGVTGTNGKTTTTYLVDCVARHMGKKTGIIGTIGAKISDKVLPGDRTTPESPDLQSLFAEMVEAGLRGCDGGFEPRNRAASRHGYALLGGGVLEPHAGPSRLPQDDGGLFQREGRALRQGLLRQGCDLHRWRIRPAPL
ncbi:MAG: hypothetical protein IKE61_04670 [Coriobacteriales bacterium]|nr:hypothetical protein [Coriobacteriales bacterium]